MKQLFLLILATICCCCSPQKRLAMLLEQHPELHTDSIYVIDTVYIHQPDTAAVTFNISDLLALQCDSVLNDTSHQAQCSTNSIQATSQSSSAVITANANGSFSLTSITHPDTIRLIDTISVPAYITKTVSVGMNSFQRIFFYTGIILTIILLFYIVDKILSHFIP